MDWRTPSSNSIGPGMRRVLCAACEDILMLFCLDSFSEDEAVPGNGRSGRSIGLYSMSSTSTDSLSDEKGVLSSGSGNVSRWSKCLEIKLRREFALPDCGASVAIGEGPKPPRSLIKGLFPYSVTESRGKALKDQTRNSRQLPGTRRLPGCGRWKRRLVTTVHIYKK